MTKSILQLREKAQKHGYTYWWEFSDTDSIWSCRQHCRIFVFNNQGQHSHLLILGFDGVLKIWLDMEDKR